MMTNLAINVVLDEMLSKVFTKRAKARIGSHGPALKLRTSSISSKTSATAINSIMKAPL
jgi:hypothetical protein